MERARQPGGVVGSGPVVDVAHGRRDVGVAEHGLHVGEGEGADGDGPERVPQRVERDAPQARSVKRPVVPLS